VPRNSTATRERVALCTCLSGGALLASYLVLHALRVAALAPAALERISPIPLFANLVASTLIGALAGVTGTSLVRTPARILRSLPTWIALLSVAFVLESVLWP
jgi:hypothetical protein